MVLIKQGVLVLAGGNIRQHDEIRKGVGIRRLRELGMTVHQAVLIQNC